ncbi:MAG: BON domain-containing protein [Sutterellaceae bacterium]|nr:BON domain-containing protein [Sutterellaceae bacterium]MDD7442581.1 BON domain-containing protein [Sutterellaceae bacterium]MDY2867225.1 BON domain-containing protein [Mesosutterella sp.]
MNKAKVAVLVLAGAAAVISSGCIPILAGGAVAETAAVASDRRSTGAQVNDGVIEKRVSWEISQKIASEDEHVTVTSYNGKILLTGEVRTDEEKRTAEEVARRSLDVKDVVNQLAVQEPVPVSQRLRDSTNATSLRSRIIATSGASLNQMKVVVDRGTAYLMGLVTEREGEIAGQVAARTKGITRVVKVFEYQTADEIRERMQSFQTEPANGSAAASQPAS